MTEKEIRDLEELRDEEYGDQARTAAEKVFVVGSPRSGTTWVQLLLAEHPDVVTAPETQIFAYYLSAFRRQWRREHDDSGSDTQGKAGLSRLLSDEQFHDLCRMTAERVLEHIGARDPEASTIVEKSPQHALYVDWIQHLFPEAHVVHVIRDPRDVASSLRAAAESWGRGWAPHHPVEAARLWTRHVKSARRCSAAGEEAYSEIKYEDLSSDATRELDRLYEALGLSSDPDLCNEAVEACRIDRLKRKSERRDRPLPGSETPEEFFRKGKSGGWREDLSRSHLRVIEHVCGDVMQKVGYDLESRPSLGTHSRIRIHDGLKRIRESVDWQFAKLLRWL